MQQESILSSPLDLSPTPTPFRRADRWLRRAVFQRLQKLAQGCVTIADIDGNHAFGQVSAACPLRATVTIHDPNAYQRLALRGSIGVGEGYMAGEWSCDDLPALVRIFVLNQDALLGLEKGLTRLMMPLFRLWYARRDNHRGGSRANIAAHYDLGNEFYRLFLDETLMYSAAIFPTPDTGLREASVAKDGPGLPQTGVECGRSSAGNWRGLGRFRPVRRAAVRLPGHHHHHFPGTVSTGARPGAGGGAGGSGHGAVPGLPRSARQFRQAGIHRNDRGGRRTVSQHLFPRLRPTAQAARDDVVAGDHRRRSKVRAVPEREVDFIRHYIFPGGFLPSLTAIAEKLARTTDLRVFHLEDIGAHYATTLRHWRERFLNNLDRVRALGFPDTFIRMWEYYLCYCEGGFRERAIGTVQLLLTKPQCRRAAVDSGAGLRQITLRTRLSLSVIPVSAGIQQPL
jgi:cyclopropane-fatty-acyl-phospholipid synthase